MSNETPDGADGPTLPADGSTEEVAEEVLDDEMVEAVEDEPAEAAAPPSPPHAPPPSPPARPVVAEAASAPPTPSPSAPDGEEVETFDVEPDPTGEHKAVPPRPAPTPPSLPGMTRMAPRPAPPNEPSAPAPEPTWPTLDETIAAARADADARTAATKRIGFYEAELAALGPQSRGRQALYAHEIGEVLAQNGDEGGAVKAWARALQADPSLRPNLWAIRRAFERRAMWPNVLKLIDAELRFAQGPSERADIFIERGVVLEDRMSDSAAAVAAYESAAKELPSSIRAFMALERRALEDNDLARHRRAVAGLAGATSDPARRAALVIDLARLEADAGAEGIDKARALLDEALALETGGADGPHFAGSSSPAALDELERLARRADRPEWKMEALEQRLRLLALDEVARPPASAADAERISRGVVLRLRQAALAEDRDDAAGAAAFLEQAAQLATDDPSAAHVVSCELRAAAVTAGRHDIVGRLALAAVPEAAPSLRGALLLEAIDAFDRAGLADDAATAIAQAEGAGLAEGIEARARRRHEQAGDDAALLRDYTAAAERAIAAQDAATGAAWLARAAAIAGEQLGQHEEALAILNRAVAMAPPGALRDELADATEWTLARLGRYDEWSALLERRLADEPPGIRRLDLLERRAGLLAERLGDLQTATLLLEEVLAARPDDLRVRYELVALARSAGDPARAAAGLAEIVARVTDEARCAEIDLERGALLMQGGDAAGAESAFREALRRAPADGRARAALEELFERRRGDVSVANEAPIGVDGLIAAIRGELDANVHPDRAPALLGRLAELQARERGDQAAAAQVYQEMFDRAGEPDEQAVAVRGLERAFASMGDRERFVAALERELDLLEDGAKPLHRTRIAWAKERRGTPDAAADDHRRLVEIDGLPPDIATTARLGRLRAAYRSGDTGELAASFGAIVGSVDPELTGARAALDLEHAAALAAQGENDEAGVVAARALAAQPDSRLAQLVALRTAGQRGDLGGVTKALFAIGENAATPSLRIPLVRRAALLAYAAGIDHQAAASWLGSLGAQDDSSVLVRAELTSGVEVLTERLALAEGAGRGPWLLRLAEAQAERGELGLASATLAQLLELEPRSISALELDRRIRAAAGDRAGAARRTLDLGCILVEAERAAALLNEAAVELEALGDVKTAVFARREALARTPFDGAVHGHARRLLMAEAKAAGENAAWARSSLLELYDLRLLNVNDLAEKVETLADRASLFVEAGDRIRAERDLRAILELDPDEARGLWPLTRLCAEDGERIAETRELFERLERLPMPDDERRALHLLVGEVESRGAGDIDRAVAALEAANAIREDLPTLRALAMLLTATRAWQRAIDVRRRIVSQVTAAEGARFELEISALYADGFHDAAAAREAAVRALALDPSSDDALAILMRGGVTTSEGAARAIEAALEAARGLLGEDDTRVRGVARMVGLATLRHDEELRSIATQLAALYEGHAPEPRATTPIPSRPIADVARAVVRSPLLDSPIATLLVALPESLAKLFPIDEKKLGKLARISAKQRDNELPIVGELARAVGARDLDLELGEGARVDSQESRVIFGRASAAALTRNVGRFRAARALSLFSDGLGALDRIDDNALLGLLAAALSLAKLEWPAELEPLRPTQQVTEERTRMLDKVVPRKERKAIIAIAPTLTKMSDPRRFRAAALSSAARSALFVTGDLAAAAEELGAATAMELGRVAVSAPFIEARVAWTGGRG